MQTSIKATVEQTQPSDGRGSGKFMQEVTMKAEEKYKAADCSYKIWCVFLRDWLKLWVEVVKFYVLAKSDKLPKIG